MNDAVVAYSSSVAVVMPLIVGVVVQSNWSKQQKGMVALIACVAAGFGSVFFAGANLSDLRIVIPAILVASQASYHAFWKPTGLVPHLEKSTDVPARKGKVAPMQPVDRATA